MINLKIPFYQTMTKKLKFVNFFVWNIWKKNNEIVCENKPPDKVIIEKRYIIPANINRIPMN